MEGMPRRKRAKTMTPFVEKRKREDKITQAAKTVQPLFRLKQWTWRDDPAPPTLLDLEATFSSLRYELERKYGDGDGSTHYAGTGRLVVVMSPSGDFTYNVQLAAEHR